MKPLAATGRYRSGQTGQTVNLLALRLRWFESSPAQLFLWRQFSDGAFAQVAGPSFCRVFEQFVSSPSILVPDALAFSCEISLPNASWNGFVLPVARPGQQFSAQPLEVSVGHWLSLYLPARQ